MKLFTFHYPSRIIYIFTLSLTAASLPVSEFTLSVGLISLLVNWLIEGDFRQKYSRIRKSPALLVFLLLFIYQVIGLLNTSNMEFAAEHIRTKLPLFIVPLVLGSSKKLTSKELYIVLLFFSLTVIAACLICLAVYLGIYPRPYTDIREISIYISHIRFSLMINLSIMVLLYFLRTRKDFYPIKFFYLTALLFQVVFLFVLQSMTGIVLLFILGYFLAFRYIFTNTKTLRLIWKGILFLLPVVLLIYIHSFRNKNFVPKPLEQELLDSITVNGNPYYHDTLDKQVENGQYLWLHYCEIELYREWIKKSTYDFWGADDKGQSVRVTMVRYLTSLGQRKDSAGFQVLQLKDIRAIESGIANQLYTQGFSLNKYLYNVLWQIHYFINLKNPAGHSVTLRYFYMKTGLQIIRENFWFGTGTGDVQDAFDEKYRKSIIKEYPDLWRRAHNQYLTFFIAFGFIGFIFTMFTFFYPVFLLRGFKSYYFAVFFIIGFMSMLTEDTLETHTGASFFALFYSLFLFATIPIESKNDET